MAAAALRSLPQRITSFLRREILSVFLPGFITLLGLSFVFMLPGLRDDKSPAEVFGRWEAALYPTDTLARLIFLVVLAYLTYGIGALSRETTFFYMLSNRSPTYKWQPGLRSRRLRRSATGSVTPSAEVHYVQEAVNAWHALVEAFGIDAVRGVFGVHGLAEVLEGRLGNLATLQKSLQVPTDGGRTPTTHNPVVPYCTRPINDTRIEFMYCKSWLSSHRSPHTTDHFEYQINVLCALVIPFATILILAGEYLYLFVLPGSWLIRLPATSVAFAALIYGQFRLFTRIVRALESHENFDTIRNFFFHHWMADLEPGPSQDGPTVAREHAVPPPGAASSAN